MKIKLPQFKKSKHPLHASLAPSGEFLARGKERFLAMFDASDLARNAAHARVISWFAMGAKVAIGGLAVVGIVAGASVYAESANVLPTNILYPLKRLNENVQVAVAPVQAKAQLQATFAARRVDEIDALQEQQQAAQQQNRQQQFAGTGGSSSGTVSSTASGTTASGSANTSTSALISGLTNDLDNEISSSITVANSSGLSNASLGAYCHVFVSSTSTSYQNRLQENLLAHPDLLSRLNGKCGDEITSSTWPGSSFTAGAEQHSTSTWQGTSHTANGTTTINFSSGTGSGRGGHDGTGFGNNATSTYETSSTVSSSSGGHDRFPVKISTSTVSSTINVHGIIDIHDNR